MNKLFPITYFFFQFSEIAELGDRLDWKSLKFTQFLYLAVTAVLDFFLSVFWLFLVLEAPNMKLTVLEDYLELGKTLEIWSKSRNNFLFFGVQNLKFHVSNPKIHIRFERQLTGPWSMISGEFESAK